MSHIASSSTAQASLRPEAGPLPTKRGEIGFNEDLHSPARSTHDTEEVTQLPPRHPADRDSPPTTPQQPQQPIPVATESADIADSVRKGGPSKRIFHGFFVKSLALLSVLVLCIIGTVSGWGVLANEINKGNVPSLKGTGATIVHIVFAAFVLAQIIFLERRFFYARAERYALLHPDIGSISRPTSVAHSIIAPWNRPPLPTYAAALAQSGVGTGDVEDHIIAAPPPPAYGHTRGSTLLLSNFLRTSIRLQRPVSAESRAERGDRPVSYRSHDAEWDEYCDAERARQLEETLSRLPRPPTAHTRD